jgi:glycosyltransferase involved in cell wall biosynthesis
MLEQITPIILTYNEAPNIGRTLEMLRWAQDIVVVDSFSHDQTLEIVSQFSNVRVFQRDFDGFASQWEFGVKETGILTEWVLALDADFILTDELVEELAVLRPTDGIAGYKAPLTYCIYGKHLRSGLLQPLKVLYRRGRASLSPDGHTHRVNVEGEVGMLRSRILHDDRKPLSRWLSTQSRHVVLEGQKLLASNPDELNFADRVRRLRIVAPIAVLLYCLIAKGGVLDGWPGFYYAFQRMLAEVLLSLHLLEHDFKLRPPAPSPNPALVERPVVERAPQYAAVEPRPNNLT